MTLRRTLPLLFCVLIAANAATRAPDDTVTVADREARTEDERQRPGATGSNPATAPQDETAPPDEPATPVDPSTRREVLDAIEGSELYVLDVDNIVRHVHAQLVVRVDGAPRTVPQLGVDYDTMTAAPIHTHDTSGRLHIEADREHASLPLLLTDFLALWAGSRQGADICRLFTGDTQCRLAVRVDGRAARIDHELGDGQAIVVLVSSRALTLI